MADNPAGIDEPTSASATKHVDAEEVGTLAGKAVIRQRMILRGPGPAGVDAAVTSGELHVRGPLTDGQLRAAAVAVSTGLTPLTDAQLRATAVPVSGPLTDAQLRAAAVTVSTGLTPLTDAQLRAAAVPVSGPLTDGQLRAAAVAVSTGLTPLTDAQLRATAVPVSGPLTDTQLRASAVPVSGPLTDAALRATPVTVEQGPSWSQIPDRPASKTGRTYVRVARTLRTTGDTLHTVTASKTLYVLAISLSAYNTGTTGGDLRIQDGASDVELPLAIPPAGSGILSSATGLAAVHLQFAEPLRFTTDFRVVLAGGTLTYACAFSGYEE